MLESILCIHNIISDSVLNAGFTLCVVIEAHSKAILNYVNKANDNVIINFVQREIALL